MKITLIIAFLLYASTAVAREPNISDLNFYRYAQPQLRNLISEFYTVLKKLNPNHKGFIQIQRSCIEHIHQLEQCRNLKYCAAVDRIADDLNIFEKNLWETLDQLNKAQVDSEVADFDAITKTNSIALELQTLVFNLKSQVEIYLSQFQPNKEKVLKHEITQELKRILILAQEGSTSLLAKNYKMEFNSITENFIRSIQSFILLKNDKLYLENRYRELDNVWNSFHLKVDREVQNFPRETLNIVKIMHNRWNSVLKLILRN